MLRFLPLVTSFAMQDFGAILNRARRNAVLYTFAAIFLFTAYVAALVGGGVYLAAMMGAVEAALVIAAGMAVLAGGLVAVVKIINSMERRREQRAGGATTALAAAAAVSVLPSILKSKALVPVAVIGGLALLLARRR